MKKFWIIIRREYLQSVRTKTFIVWTLLGPLLFVGLMTLPALIIQFRAGGPTRLAILDQTGRMHERARQSIQRGDAASEEETAPASGRQDERARELRSALVARYEIEPVAPAGRSPDEVKRELNERVLSGQLDAYVVLPPDILERGEAEFYGRNLGDVITISHLRNRLSRAVIEQRMSDAQIDQARVRELSRGISLSTIRVDRRGTEEASSGNFGLALGVGAFIVLAILSYGQVILSAVVEEKTTRLTEVLFSSVRPFTLMAGKLTGVMLVALTQYAVWAILALGVALYGLGALAASGMNVSLPGIQPAFILYAFLYFIMGFALYATLYAVVGAVVTTEKEAGQMAIALSMILATGIYLSFPVIRSPNSNYAFWVSMIPFVSPITMLVRIVTETPPFWQIALSLAIGFALVVFMVWLAARIYRIGMLMYGKRATIPEVLRWVRQA